MDLSIEVLTDISPDSILATDGSIEGLFTSLSTRPGKPSVFLRDEFSGLLEAMSKKDYYAGMAETFTKLYDGKFQKRILRKETLEVRDPVLILFAGGIKSRIMQLLDYEQVSSGFLPRFIFITAESDIKRLRPLGPPSEQTVGDRDRIVSSLRSMAAHYSSQSSITVGDKTVTTDRKWNAELTPAAWDRYNKFESDMLKVGLTSMHAEVLTPSFDRLAKSGLKIAVLLAASRLREEKVIVEERDLCKAIKFVEEWRPYTLEVLNNIGTSAAEKEISSVLRSIEKKPGVLRSELMQFHHLDSRRASLIFGTLEERGMISVTKSGKSQRYSAFK